VRVTVTDAELITDVAGLRALAPEWDRLAVAASNPVSAPAWALSWWRHVAAPELEPRVVVVRERGVLIGVAAFYLAPARRGIREARLMGSDFGVCMEPLALGAREWDVAEGIGRVLAASQPRPDLVAFGPMALASHWATALRTQWPGPLLGVSRQYRVEGAPVIVLREPSFDAWFATLSAKLRHSLRRGERAFAEAGGTTRWSTRATLRADAEAFAELHAARWKDRGWSRLADLGEHLPDWLEELGSSLIDSGRFRMCVLEVAGAPVCVDFGLLAGRELAAVNSGWDERYAKLAPAKLAVLRVVQGAYERGCERVHLGVGEKASKLRLANGNDPVAWTIFMPPSSRLPRTYGGALPALLRRRASDAAERALPADKLEALRRLRG
ncbi:MAG TPA: GNAT family N-acetyltransferase, partial [Solirubrobacteraceae bacterium]|jgi:CelD/BcsL family acetyltransferase involved in cellulose biosynthesis|nr:GNAT family N-acetyltransferase [Solirubrobacteraceae bacterium]